MACLVYTFNIVSYLCSLLGDSHQVVYPTNISYVYRVFHPQQVMISIYKDRTSSLFIVTQRTHKHESDRQTLSRYIYSESFIMSNRNLSLIYVMLLPSAFMKSPSFVIEYPRVSTWSQLTAFRKHNRQQHVRIYAEFPRD